MNEEKVVEIARDVPPWLDLAVLAAHVPEKLLLARPDGAYVPTDQFVSGNNPHAVTVFLLDDDEESATQQVEGSGEQTKNKKNKKKSKKVKAIETDDYGEEY